MDINTFLIDAFLICVSLATIVCCFAMCYMAAIMTIYVRKHKNDDYIETEAVGFNADIE